MTFRLVCDQIAGYHGPTPWDNHYRHLPGKRPPRSTCSYTSDVVCDTCLCGAASTWGLLAPLVSSCPWTLYWEKPTPPPPFLPGWLKSDPVPQATRGAGQSQRDSGLNLSLGDSSPLFSCRGAWSWHFSFPAGPSLHSTAERVHEGITGGHGGQRQAPVSWLGGGDLGRI